MWIVELEVFVICDECFEFLVKECEIVVCVGNGGEFRRMCFWEMIDVSGVFF